MSRFHIRSGLLTGIALLGARAAIGQVYMPVEEPRLLQVRFSRGHLSLDVSEDTIRTTSKNTADSAEHSRFDLRTRIGLSLNGHIYHPKLLTFSFEAEEGRTSESIKESTAATSPDTQDFTGVARGYSAGIAVLSGKPYAVTISGHQGVARREYDFFTRATVETSGYVIFGGYAAGVFPVNVSYSRRREEVSDWLSPGQRVDAIFSVRANNSRSDKSYTNVKYQRRQFQSEQDGSEPREGSTDDFLVSDVERFRDDKIVLRSRLIFNRLQDEYTDRRRLSVRESLRIDHRSNLSSRWQYRYHGLRFNGEMSGTHDVVSSLVHQLYASLRSTFTVSGSVRDFGNTGLSSYGFDWAERYTKRLSSWGNLIVNTGLGLSQGRNDASQSDKFVGEQTIALNDANVVFLSDPNVDRNSIVVSDTSGVIVYTEGLDYAVSQQGSLTEIRRLSGGSISNGSSVLVEYTAEAQPADTYSAMTRRVSSRLSFWKQKVTVSASYYNSANSGGTSLIREDVTDVSVGAHLSLNHLYASAEYLEHDSSITPYRSTRLRQGLSFTLAGSPLTFDFQEMWTDYLATSEKREYYSAVGRYGLRLLSTLVWRAEGGFHMDRGLGVDLRRKVARTGLTFRLGKLTADAGYQYEDSDSQGESTRRQTVFGRVSRMF